MKRKGNRIRDNTYKMLQRKIYSDPEERCALDELDGCPIRRLSLKYKE